MLIERVLVDEMLTAQGTAELATTCRGSLGASEAGSRVHCGAVPIHGLLGVEKDAAFAARGRFKWEGVRLGWVLCGAVPIHGLL